MSSDFDDGPSGQSASPKVRYWLGQIHKAEKDMEKWHKTCDRIRKRYLFEGRQDNRRRMYQMLWSNQEILRPAIYAKCPSPVVQSRFRDGDKLIRVAGELLERTMDVQLDINDYDHAFQLARNDYLLYARGVMRLAYEPTLKPDDDEIPESDDGKGLIGDFPREDIEYERVEVDEDYELGDDEKESPPEVLKAENIKPLFVHRKDFIHPHCRNWSELPWCIFRGFLTRKQLIDKWGFEVGSKIPLDCKPTSDKEDYRSSENESEAAKATIYEIWDKTSNKVIFIAKAFPEVLEDDEPYLKFNEFFPLPRPLYGTLDTESITPTPDFVFYQDQSDEINDLTARIGALTDSLKLVGFYPAGPQGEGTPEVEKAVVPGFENKMIPVKSWAAFTKSGGKDGVPIVWLPVEMVATIIRECIELRKQLIDDVYQITGISDIMRGDTEAEETAAAQGLKANWGSVRLKQRQNELARFARDVMRMMAEVITSQFQIETMLECANIKLPTDADQQAATKQFQQQQLLAAQAKAAQLQASGMPPGGGASPSGPQPGSMPGASIPNPAGAAPPPLPVAGGAMPPQQAGMSSQQGVAPAPAPSPPPSPPDLGPTQEDVKRFLSDKVLVKYVVDIEADSTILLDQEKEQKQRIEFISESARFMTAVLPVAQEQPAMLPFIGQLFLFGVRAFPVARELQDAAEKMVDQLEQMAGQPKPPSAEMLKAQADMEKAKVGIETAKIGQQTEVIRAKAEQQTAMLKVKQAEAEHGMKMQQMRLEAQNTAQEHDMKQKTMMQEVQLMERKMAAQQSLEGMKAQFAHDEMRTQHMHSMIEGQTAHDQTMQAGKQAHEQGLAAQEQKSQLANEAATHKANLAYEKPTKKA